MYTLIRYAEIALKGDNRGYFESILVQNVNKATGLNAERQRGRIILPTSPVKLKNILKSVPGISSFSFAIKSSLDINDIGKTVLSVSKKSKFNSFKIKTIRANKKFSKTSLQLNQYIGDLIPDKHSVSLDNPDLTFYIEISDKESFIYTEKIPGVGGLPVGVTGKIISLISGGIDSPVASYLMMKRGCRLVYLHFHHHGKIGSKNKVKKLTQILSKFGKGKLYLIEFEKIQKEIIKVIPSKYRMIVYRRVMLKIAEVIRRSEKALGFVTGDSLAQVASQTLQNLNVIYSVSSFPILSPLIGMDKVEIMDLARKIETYETSILPHEDCCSYLIDKHPETKAKLEEIEKLEENLDIDAMITDVVQSAPI